MKQDLRSVTEAGGDPITISSSTNYVSSSYEVKTLPYKLCKEYLITTKACTVDSIVESAVLSMKVISHTTQGMQVSYNAMTPLPNNQSFILATCSRKHKLMGMKLTQVRVYIHVQNKHYIHYVLIFKDIPTI